MFMWQRPSADLAVCSAPASFPTTPARFRLLSWLCAYGTVDRIGVEGTGRYGARARSIPQRARNVGGRGFRAESAPRSSSWQERHHRCDRQCSSGDRRRGPPVAKSHDGAVETLPNAERRAAQRNQDPHCCIEPAAQPRRDRSQNLRERLRALSRRNLHDVRSVSRARRRRPSGAITCVKLRGN